MADEETIILLKAWGFENSLIQHFQAQEINMTLLKCLTHDLIKELIPNIGIRMRFIIKWEEHFRIPNEKNEKREPYSTDTLSSSFSESEEENTDPIVLKKQKCFVGKEMYKRLQRPTVREILKECEQGRMILRTYSQTKILSKHCRNILVELIVSYLLNTVKGPINKHDFLDLARGIVEIFPSEDINLYYKPPISKKES
ncbi:PREDICTED: uncharacterized protein LOC105462503 [Wasmannia auropunctata]|uniref:uncharacterized protein LOC105462503 n=1 Tax=Wasmannia auropunctata TaxID=64793 RepID=UPI0005EF1F3D|nr:PREDICTED: uncharacterized protein LOC105462503 [Wasmannia auropunctata]